MENYKLVKPIGVGSFGQVYKAIRLSDGEIVAYKITVKKGRSDKELKSLKQECEVQRNLRHPNIVQMLDSFETEYEFVVVTEYAERELYELLGKARTNKLSEERVQIIACDLVSALYYLHSNRILHRDLKPQNVLLDTTGVAKVCDFGFARSMSSGTHYLTSIKGTPLYMAPELIEGLPYDHNVDLWSLGCIIYELVVGVSPFQADSIGNLVKLIWHKEIEWPENISDECRSFLQGLLQKDPLERLTWPALLQHPFVKGKILMSSNNARVPLTAPPSASQAWAKHQQLQELALQFMDASKKMMEKCNLKYPHAIHRKSEPTLPRSDNSSLNVVLSNPSLRSSLCVDLQAVQPSQHHQPFAPTNFNQSPGANTQNKVNDPLLVSTLSVPPPMIAQCRQHRESNETRLNNYGRQTDSSCVSSDPERQPQTRTEEPRRELDVEEVVRRHARIPDWEPRDSDKNIENEEWEVFLQKSMEEMMDGELGSLLQENCVSVFVSPLMNPLASPKVIDFVSCLLSLPFVLSVSPEDLQKIKRLYMKVHVVPSLVYACKLFIENRDRTQELQCSNSSSTRSTGLLAAEELQALGNAVLLICRLVHEEPEFLQQFCDAIYVTDGGIALLQQMITLERRKVQIVSDLVAILIRIMRSQTDSDELVDKILLMQKSPDDVTDQVIKLMKTRNNSLKIRMCNLLQVLAKLVQKTLQRFWNNNLKKVLEELADDKESSIRNAAAQAIAEIRELPFYNQ